MKNPHRYSEGFPSYFDLKVTIINMFTTIINSKNADIKKSITAVILF